MNSEHNFLTTSWFDEAGMDNFFGKDNYLNYNSAPVIDQEHNILQQNLQTSLSDCNDDASVIVTQEKHNIPFSQLQALTENHSSLALASFTCKDCEAL